MIVFLFDIDGTLLLTGGAGRLAMQDAMREIYQLEDLAQIDVHGRTDYAIVRDLFQAHQIDHTRESNIEFFRHYHRELGQSISVTDAQLMPGVPKLLEQLQARPDVELGLLTGNSMAAAKIKLSHFDLDHYFQFGGFGDRHADRNHVAREAYQQCESHLGTAIATEQLWVVGDTVHDVRCARSIGANVIAVATGGVPREELQREQPDVFLDDLSDPAVVLQVIK